MYVNTKDSFMRKYENPLEELKVIRKFMKEKKIKYVDLAAEMDYSAPHLISVFNGTQAPTAKLRTRLLKGLHQLLEKDLNEFYSILTQPRAAHPPWEDVL